MITDFGMEMFQDSYLMEGESVDDLYHRVASANCGDNAERIERIKGYFKKLWFLGATPVLSNSGTDRGYPISCYTANTYDNMKSICEGYIEDMVLGSGGGGIGRIKYVRSVGEKISDVGKSSGKIPFYKVDDSIVNAVSQGALRRASKAEWLHISDPEIEEFIKIRKPTGGDANRKCFNLHHGVVISDEFMEAVLQGKMWKLLSVHTQETIKEVDAYDLFCDILTSRIETGEPFIMFEDTVNRGVPDLYKKEGYKISLSNLCVTGDTKVLTKELGYVPIKEVEGQTLECWNGTEWSKTDLFKTSEGQKVIKVVLSNGNFVEATPYHKWYVAQQDKRGGYIGEVMKRTSELLPGDKFVKYNTPSCEVCGDEFIKVLEVIDEDKVVETWCGNEPKKHRLMFNGVLTGNCSEIVLHTSEEKTAVCCLASVNLETYDEWKDDELFLEDCMYFLDGVLNQFLQKIEDSPKWKKQYLQKVVNFIFEERAVALGVMGWHGLLQQKHIPFESAMAKGLNLKIFSHIRDEADKASIKIAKERGSCELAQKYGVFERFTHKLAIAPTGSISILCGEASPGIEPRLSNSYVHKNKTKAHSVKNKYLAVVMQNKATELEKDGRWVTAQWKSITANNGSAQHLEWMDEYTKDVYKTAYEIDQRYIIEQAADRTPSIDQSQSLNIFLPHDVSKKDLLALHLYAWKKGVKTLYYCRSTSPKRATIGQKVDRKEIFEDNKYAECLSCT